MTIIYQQGVNKAAEESQVIVSPGNSIFGLKPLVSCTRIICSLSEDTPSTPPHTQWNGGMEEGATCEQDLTRPFILKLKEAIAHLLCSFLYCLG